MNNRENYLSLAHKKGYEKVPIEFNMSPSLKQKFMEYQKEHLISFIDEKRYIPDLKLNKMDKKIYQTFYDIKLDDKTYIDSWGVAHVQGSKSAMHMTRMLHPMKNFDSVEQVLQYPFPDFNSDMVDHQTNAVSKAIKDDCITFGIMPMTIWETSWYLRSMENLMADMMMEDPIAQTILDKVTEIAIMRAKAYAKAGCDILVLGDDIGMQISIMMSESLYCDWLKPRLKKVIDTAKKIKPDILIYYHSCGYITPFIPHLIEVGVDILNPIQPECMDFREIHDKFGDKLAFNGTIGTQTTMPFGTPDDVRREVFRNLDIAGDKGGLFVCPAHMLEPEVPVENIVAYINACKDYRK